jgi:anti-anti-sigma factor
VSGDGGSASRQPFELARADEGDVPVILVRGEVDTVTASELERALVDLAGAPSRVVLDCRDLTFIDSAGLKVFVDAHERLRDRGGMLVIRALGATPRRIFEITDLVRYLDIED